MKAFRADFEFYCLVPSPWLMHVQKHPELLLHEFRGVGDRIIVTVVGCDDREVDAFATHFSGKYLGACEI